jgi:hypothetical protein
MFHWTSERRNGLLIVKRKRSFKGCDAWPALPLEGTDRDAVERALQAAFGADVYLEAVEPRDGTPVLIAHELGDPRDWDSESRFLWAEVVHGNMPSHREGHAAGCSTIRPRSSPAAIDLVL